LVEQEYQLGRPILFNLRLSRPLRKTRVSGPSTPTRLFTVGWVAAVVIATAGWFYFIFESAWYLIDALAK
jgi:hypothetical protein